MVAIKLKDSRLLDEIFERRCVKSDRAKPHSSPNIMVSEMLANCRCAVHEQSQVCNAIPTLVPLEQQVPHSSCYCIHSFGIGIPEMLMGISYGLPSKLC